MRQREASNLLRCEKRKYIQGTIRDSEQDYKIYTSKDQYRKVHALSKDFESNEKFLRNENGTPINNNKCIARRWSHYFDQLLNCGNPQNPLYV